MSETLPELTSPQQKHRYSTKLICLSAAPVSSCGETWPCLGEQFSRLAGENMAVPRCSYDWRSCEPARAPLQYASFSLVALARRLII